MEYPEEAAAIANDNAQNAIADEQQAMADTSVNTIAPDATTGTVDEVAVQQEAPKSLSDPFNYWDKAGRKKDDVRQSDYYPTPNNGQWGSPDGNFKLATYGQVPARIWGQQIASIREQKAALQKAISQFDPNKGIDSVPAQYQKSFNGRVRGVQNDFMDSAIEQYGGNRQRANREIATEGTELNRKWKQLNKDLNDEGRFIKYQVGEMLDRVKGMESGDRIYNQQLHDRAFNMAKGLGEAQENNVGSVRKLSEDRNNYLTALAPEQVMESKGYDKIMKDFLAQHPENYSITAKNGIQAITWDDKKGLDERTNKLAQEIWDQGYLHDVYDTEEDFAKYLREVRYPVSVVRQVRTNSIPGAGGGGGSQKDLAKQIRLVPRVETVQANSMGQGGFDLPTLGFTDGTGNALMKQQYVSNGKKMYPMYIQYNPRTDKTLLWGEDAEVVDKMMAGKTEEEKMQAWTQMIVDAQKLKDNPDAKNSLTVGTNDSKSSSMRDTKQRPLFSVPLDKNEDVVTTIAQGEEWRQWLDGARGSGSNKAPTKQVDDKQVKTIKASYPDAVLDPKHGWIAKGPDGKWHKVNQ